MTDPCVAKEGVDVVSLVGGFAALLALGLAVLEFVDANAIRRYEKFHEMSRRFQDSEGVQRVIEWLHRSREIRRGGEGEIDRLSLADKERFACLIEEVYYMVNSKIIREEIALYSYGYYVKMALADPWFHQDVIKSGTCFIDERFFPSGRENPRLESLFWKNFEKECPNWIHYIRFAQMCWAFDPLKPERGQRQSIFLGRLGLWRFKSRNSSYTY